MSEKERPYPMPKDPMPQYPPSQYQSEPVYPPVTDYPQRYYDNLDLPKGELKGYFKAYTLDYDRDPNRVLERPRAWYIVAEWAIIGTAAVAFGGTFHVSGFAESIGPNKDPNIPSELKIFEDLVNVSDAEPGRERQYKLEVTIPGDVIPQDGAYKVVVLLTHSNTGYSGKEHFSRLAGFVEIPLLQFYTAEE